MEVLKNQKGLSFIEVMMAAAISIFVFAGSTQFLMSFYNNIYKMEGKIEEKIGRELVFKHLWKDLTQSAPSFNNISLNISSSRGFFDYLPGCPPQPNSQGKLRKLKLTSDKPNQKIQFLAFDKSYKMPVVIDPVKAYSTPTSKDVDVESPISFISLKKVDSISNFGENFWINGRWLYLYSPIWYRHDLNNTCSQEKFPSQPSFLGVIKGKRLVAHHPSGFTFEKKIPHRPGREYSSEDSFLRNLPSVGGAATIAFLRPVVIITYEFKKEGLIRTIDDGVSEPSEQLIGVDIEHIELTRSDLSNQVINVSVKAKND